MSEWTKIAEITKVETSYPEGPSQQNCFRKHHLTRATMFRRGQRYCCQVKGNRESTLTDAGNNETEGCGDSVEEAIKVCRKDVLAWAKEHQPHQRAELATMLRHLLYAAEDFEAEDNLSGDLDEALEACDGEIDLNGT